MTQSHDREATTANAPPRRHFSVTGCIESIPSPHCRVMSSVPVKLVVVRWRKGDACLGFCVDACLCHVSCKWCLRSFGQEDPLNIGFAIQRPGGRGLMCEQCRNTIHWQYRTETTKQLKERLAACAKHLMQRIIHQNLVQEWLDEHKDNNVARMDFNKRKAVALMEEAEQFRATKMMGYLWPTEVWHEYFSKTWAQPDLVVPENRVQRFKIGETFVAGILESPSAGWAPGIYDLNTDITSKAARVVEACSTDDGLTEDQVTSNYENMARDKGINVSADMGANGCIAKINVAPAVAAESEDEDDDCRGNDFLKKYGGSAVVTTQAAVPPASKAAVHTPSGSAAKPKKASVASASGSMAPEKSLKEFQASQIVAAEVKHLLVRLGINETAETVKEVQLQKLSAKVEKRLSPALVEQFQSEDNGREAVQQELRNSLWVLAAGQELLASFHAGDDSYEYAPAVLRQKYDDFGAALAKYDVAFRAAVAFPFSVVSRAVTVAFGAALHVYKDKDSPLSAADVHMQDVNVLLRVVPNPTAKKNPLVNPAFTGVASLQSICKNEEELHLEQTKQMRALLKKTFALHGETESVENSATAESPAAEPMTAREAAHSFYSKRSVCFTRTALTCFVDVDTDAEAKESIEQHLLLLKAMEVEDVNTVHEALMSLNSSPHVFSKDLRCAYGEELKKVAWSVVTMRLQDKQLSDVFRSLKANVEERFPSAASADLARLLEGDDIDGKRATIRNLQTSVLDFKRAWARSSGFAVPSDTDYLRTKLTAIACTIASAIKNNFEQALRAVLTSSTGGPAGDEVAKALAHCEATFKELGETGLFVDADEQNKFSKVREDHKTALDAVKHGMLNVVCKDAHLVGQNFDMNACKAWCDHFGGDEKALATKGMFSKDTADEVELFQARCAKQLHTAAASLMSAPISQDPVGLAAIDFLTGAAGSKALAKRDLWGFLSAAKVAKYLGSENSLTGLCEFVSGLITKGFFQLKQTCEVTLTLDDEGKSCSLPVAIVAAELGRFIRELCGLHQKLAAIQTVGKPYLILRRLKEQAAVTRDIPGAFANCTNMCKEVVALFPAFGMSSAVLDAILEVTMRSLSDAITEKMRVVVTTMVATLVEATKNIPKEFNVLNGAANIRDAEVEPLLDLLESSPGVKEFRKAWDAYERSEAIPQDIETLLKREEAVAKPLVEKRAAVARISETRLAELDKAAAFQFSAVVLQACLRSNMEAAAATRVVSSAADALLTEACVLPRCITEHANGHKATTSQPRPEATTSQPRPVVKIEADVQPIVQVKKELASS